MKKSARPYRLSLKVACRDNKVQIGWAVIDLDMTASAKSGRPLVARSGESPILHADDEFRPLSAAEFKTLRQSLGLSLSEAADYLDIRSTRTITAWESGRVDLPDGAAQELLSLQAHMKDGAAAAVMEWRKHKDRCDSVELYRYRSQEDYVDSRSHAEGVPLGAHSKIIEWAAEALRTEGAEVFIMYAEHRGY